MKSGLGGITEEMEKDLPAFDEEMTKMVREEFEGSWPGMVGRQTDEQFRRWFAMMLKGYGPDWARALEYVDGGPETLKRWNRIVQEVSGGLV